MRLRYENSTSSHPATGGAVGEDTEGFAVQIGVIINPRSRRNRRSPDRARQLAALVDGVGAVRETADMADLSRAVEQLLAAGATYLVSDGGDGTYHCLVNATREVVGDGVLPSLVPTAGGTIDFVAKSAGLRGADVVLRSLAREVRAGGVIAQQTLPTLEVVGRRPGEATPFRRLGFAAALGGVGQRFFSAYYAEPTQGGLAALRVILKAATGVIGGLPGLDSLPGIPKEYKALGRRLTLGTRADVTADGRTFSERELQGLHVGSIRVDLGAVRLFPEARPGRLHMVVGAMTPVEAAWKWAFLAAGRPAPGARWQEFGGTSLEVVARGDEWLDPVIDGECYHGFAELSVRPGPELRFPTLRG